MTECLIIITQQITCYMEDDTDVTDAVAVLERLRHVAHEFPAGVLIGAALFVVVVVRYIYPLFFKDSFILSSSNII